MLFAFFFQLFNFYLFRYYLEPASPLKSLTNTSHATQAQQHQNQSSVQSEQNDLTNVTKPATNIWSLSSTFSSNTNGNGVSALSSSDNKFYDQFTSNDNNKISNKINLNGNDKLNGNHSVLSHKKHNGNMINSLSRPIVNNDSHAITKNSLSLHQSAEILEKSNNHINHHNININNNNNNQNDFVADFGSADIFNAALQISPRNGKTPKTTPIGTNKSNKLMNGSFTSADFDNISSGSNVSISNGNSSFDGDANANFADFEHNTIYNAVGTCKLFYFDCSNFSF